MTELLAPAGDMARLKIALLYGADAVYIGGKDYSLRANAKNFSLKEIEEACVFAHELGRKVYVAVNIVFHDQDLVSLATYLESLAKIKVDAVIVSDIVAVKMAQEASLPVILSTQSSTLNYQAIKFWQSLGIDRFVLGREASREDIIKIKKETNANIEVFIHGAMCTAVSGKCVLSNYMTGRDSNRGGCAQICRWAFQTENGPDFTLMSKDLNMVDYIADMLQIGVNSFKIEGRMRSIYYIATVVNCYRKIIDGIKNKTLTPQEKIYYKNVLDRVANRDSLPQFYQKFPGVAESYFQDYTEVSNQDFLGIVLAYDIDKRQVLIEQHNYFKVGDVVEFFGPNMSEYAYTITEIIAEDGSNLTVARHPLMHVYLPILRNLEKDTMMRLKVFDK